VRQQPTTTPTVLVFTVNGQPTRAYLHHPDGPPRRLVGELDGYQVVWTPTRHGSSCGRHPHLGGCPCITRLARLATPDALRAWYQALGWRQRRQLHTATAALATGPPRWEPPDWATGWGSRLLLAALLLAFLLLVTPLLHR
jgi:hypothetical protein